MEGKTISVRYDPETMELLVTDKDVGKEFDGAIFMDVKKVRIELS